MTTLDPPPLAKNIKAIRRFHRLTQVDLAERSKLSHKTIYSIEHGEHEPNMATIKAIARALNTTPKVLLADPDAMSSTSRWLTALRALFRGNSRPFRRAVVEYVRRLTSSSATTRIKS
jgi:transcriptional regulator with XRE-family HTH domain